MNKRYIVRLRDEERETLRKLISTGEAPAYQIRHAPILLKVDADGPNWTDEAVAEAFGGPPNTVAPIRRRFGEGGLEAALACRKRPYPPPGGWGGGSPDHCPSMPCATGRALALDLAPAGR